jgi:hypothetical protein
MAPATLCPGCAFYRLRARPALFSAADMQSVGGLKASLEWEQQQDQLRLLEQQRIEAAQVLTYEPHFHPWCAAASPFDETVLRAVDEAIGADEAQRPGLSDTARDAARISRGEAAELIGRARHGDYEAMTRLVEGQRATVNPVAGDIQQTYVLCERVNRFSRCPLFEPREA